MVVVLLVFAIIAVGHANVFHDCSKQFNPQHYMDQLPSLSLPYISSVPIPSQIIPLIVKPSPVLTTKMISIVTKYVAKNPVCIKVTGSKQSCHLMKSGKNKSGLDYMVAKEYIVGNRNAKEVDNFKRETYQGEELIQSSETFRAHTTPVSTPFLDSSIRHILIDDRLNHLEQILPYYTRRKNYETSTITVTRFTNRYIPMATLVVKNCIPAGMAICPKKAKIRKKKLQDLEISSDVNNNFF